MRKPSIVYEGDNFLLVRKRKGEGPVIIQTSGYTMTADAVNQSWIVTNLQTVPKRDRSELSDPFIFNQTLPCYKILDAQVIELYFLPECKGLKDAADEFADLFQSRFADATLIGHSKGGLFVAAVLERVLSVKAKAIIIAPTLGTVTGDEELMLKKLKENERFFLARLFWRFIIKTVGSRRPVDRDMSYDSEFLDKTKTDQMILRRHYLLSVYACCPFKKDVTFVDKVFMKFGKVMGLDLENSDGMVDVRNQEFFRACDFVIQVRAVHPMALKKSNDIILKYIIKHEAY